MANGIYAQVTFSLQISILFDHSTESLCIGDDNSSPYCSSGDVANVIVGEVKDHDGPYDGIMISCK